MPLDATFRRTSLKLFLIGTVGTVFGTVTPGAKENPDPGRLFTFNDWAGNQRPLVGSEGEIRGISAGGLPCVDDEAHAKLHSNGHLRVRVKGLVIDPDDDEPGDPAWKNTRIQSHTKLYNYREQISEVVNLRAGTVPRGEAGDAKISEILDVPGPCHSPIVFVTSPGDSGFAATGTR